MPQPTKSSYDQIRVVGSPEGYWVKDAKGQNMHVFGVDAALRNGRPPVLRINLICGNLDIAGHPVFAIADPATGQARTVRKITWLDGTEVEFPIPPSPPPSGEPAAATQKHVESNGADVDTTQAAA